MKRENTDIPYDSELGSAHTLYSTIIKYILLLTLFSHVERVFEPESGGLWGSPLSRSINLLLITAGAVAWVAYEVLSFAERKTAHIRESKIREANELYGKLIQKIHQELRTILKQQSSHE